MKRKIGGVDIYICDFYNCAEKEIVGHNGNNMCEIIFGVHPNITTDLNKKGIEVPVIQKTYHFCQKNNHYLTVKEGILNLVADCHSGPISNICTKAELVNGLGCWITIIDRIAREKIKNFQLPFSLFELIYKKFLRSLCKGFENFEINAERVAELCNLV